MYSSTLSAVCAVALGAVIDVSLRTEGSGPVNNKGLSDIHEGAGINYFFLGDNGRDYKYDTDSKTLYEVIGNGVPNFNASIWSQAHALTIGVLGGYDQLAITNGYLTVNGSAAGFFAGKHTNDPYSYSDESYQVLYYPNGGQPNGSLPIKIKADEKNSASSSSAGVTPNASAHIPVPTGGNVTTSPAAGAGNTTTTDISTVLTTYCPGPTTFSWAGSQVTVSEATTLTLTDCGCTKKPTVAPTVAPTAQNGSASNTTAAPIANGAGSVGVGAAGLVAAVAYLL